MHLITHMDGLPYHCTICRNTFSKSNHLVIHMNNHSWNKCDICTSGNFKLTCLTQLSMHLITHMDCLPYHCTVYGKNFSKSNHLVIHMNNHSWNKCDVCTSGNFEFTCFTQLRMHLITNIDCKLYHCTICGNTFSTSKHLVIHMKKSLLE